MTLSFPSVHSRGGQPLLY